MLRDSYQMGDEGVEVFDPVESTGASAILQKLAQNPSAIKSILSLSEEQAVNVRALLAGGGAALGSKYLGNAIGDELAAAIGAIGGAYLAKHIIGR